MKYTYKQIWLINFPVMMSILMEQLINITDAVFLGHVGEIELGASALAGIYYLAIYMLGFGFSIGLQVMIARRNGEQHYKETGRTFFQGLYFLMTTAIMLCLLIQLVSPFILQQLITSDEIYQAVIRYLDWRSFGLLFSFPFLAFRAFLVGITNTKALSGAALTAVCINIPFNYLLIFKLNMGISGAAMASSIAEFGAFLILLLYMCKTVDKKKYGLSAVYDGRLLIKLLQLSVWSMLHAFISVAPWFLFFVAIEHLQYYPKCVYPLFCDSQFFRFYYRIVSQQSDRGRTGEGTFSCLPQSSQIRLCGRASIDTDSSLGQSMDHRILYE